MSNRIYIIGMGPGREEMMTGEAIAALEQADVIVGYTVYVKLLGERFAGKRLLTTSCGRRRSAVSYASGRRKQEIRWH